MENDKGIGKATKPEPRSVLLIDGRGEGDAPIDSWEDLLNTAYSKIAPVDDGISHLDIDGFKDCFDIHEGVAFPHDGHIRFQRRKLRGRHRPRRTMANR